MGVSARNGAYRTFLDVSPKTKCRRTQKNSWAASLRPFAGSLRIDKTKKESTKSTSIIIDKIYDPVN